MNKRIFIFLLSLAICVVARTQTLWSNWSVGGNVTYAKTIKNFDNWEVGKGTSLGFGVLAKKQIFDKINVRFSVDVSGLMRSDPKPFDRFVKTTAGVMYGKNLYFSLNGGMVINHDQFGHFTLVTEFGPGYAYNLSEKHSLYAELVMDIVSDIRTKFETSNIYLRIGYMYNFGLCKKDIDRKEQLDELYACDARLKQYTDSIAKRAKEFESYKNTLIERINTMENENMRLKSDIDGCIADIRYMDSLIYDIKDNQDIMYAFPFSIEFPLNSYTFPKEQKYRIEQIAKVMLSDSSSTFYVAGYCDSTGSEEYNQTLSEKRAKTVANELIKCGVPEDKLIVIGKGKTIAFGELSSKINRRVSFYKNF